MTTPWQPWKARRPPRMEMPLPIAGGSLLLRPYCAEDAERQLAAVHASIAEVSPWMGWANPGYSIEDSRRWVERCIEGWENGAQYAFCLFDPEAGLYCGNCTLSAINEVHGFANLGYWIRTGFAGRGAATAATRAVARFGLEEVGLHRVEIVAAVDNRASQRVAEKAGAVREGVLRRRIAEGPTPQDAVMFSLIASDLER